MLAYYMISYHIILYHVAARLQGLGDSSNMFVLFYLFICVIVFIIVKGIPVVLLEGTA